jgi:hypothetical protein
MPFRCFAAVVVVADVGGWALGRRWVGVFTGVRGRGDVGWGLEDGSVRVGEGARSEWVEMSTVGSSEGKRGSAGGTSGAEAGRRLVGSGVADGGT